MLKAGTVLDHAPELAARARAAVRKYGSIGAAVAAGVATPEEVA